ncbi:MAG: hypothetical protein GY799_12260 [Desulfobulbaceae bacterium]|nr:hypothetical protein [Desulfobulbaceae bacterium]
MKEKITFIAEPFQSEEVRFLSEREEDTKEVKAEGYSFTIIPLSGQLRQRVQAESRKRDDEKEPIMLDRLGWSEGNIAKAKDIFSKDFKDRSGAESTLLMQWLHDDNVASKAVMSNADPKVASAMLNECIVDHRLTDPEAESDDSEKKEFKMGKTMLSIVLSAIESHSSLRKGDELAL